MTRVTAPPWMEKLRMQGNRSTALSLTGIVISIGVMILSGCATTIPEYVPVEPVIEVTPVAKEPVPAPLPDIAPEPRHEEVRALPAVTIVLTSRQPAYEDVAIELGKHLQDVTIFDLSEKDQPPVVAFGLINDSDTKAIVAIGLRAAKSSVAMARTPVVFSQVFNYQDHNLLTDSSRGVAALPPLEAHIAAWKKIDPSIMRIGAIIGHGHEALIAEAKRAAEKHGVELHLRTVQSDRETLYYFNRMIRDIDGFWLFPDNRVLSGSVLRKMLAEANRHQVPVAVPNESILSMGAAISFSSVAADIASTIIRVVRQIDAGNIEKVPPLSDLSEIRVVTNDTLLNAAVNTTSTASNQAARNTLR